MTPEQLRESIDALNSVDYGDEPLTISRRRLAHLREVERAAYDFHLRIQDVDGHRQTLAELFKGER